MRFQCPFCRGIVSVDNADMGTDVQCGHCGVQVTVPTSRVASGAVIGDFIILREIGRGGMGIVYLAHQISLDRPAGLKVLAENYANNAEFVVGFIKEARAAAKLNHPNIVQAYAVGEDEGIFYFAMEYIDGETMKNVLKREQVIPVDQAISIIQQISDRKVTFTDPCGDVATPLSDDLISGSAEVRNDSLYLTCRAADPFKNPLRIFIDSIPNSGYGPGEADFMIERGKLFRYTGTPEKRWSWEKNLWHNVQMKFSADKREVSCSILLSEIRNDLPGRIRVTFSSACKGSLGDSMPTFGKVIPVLRPGNLAAQKDTKLSVSSTYPKYKTFPLIDGQAARQAYYSFAAWASANVKEDHFVDFQFTKSEQPKIVTIWWEMEPQEILIQTKNDQEWQTVVDYQVPEKEECSYIRLPKGFKSTSIRIKMPAGKGNKRRSQLLWIREIEIY